MRIHNPAQKFLYQHWIAMIEHCPPPPVSLPAEDLDPDVIGCEVLNLGPILLFIKSIKWIRLRIWIRPFWSDFERKSYKFICYDHI